MKLIKKLKDNLFLQMLWNNFQANAKDPLKLSIIYSLLIIIAFLTGLLFGAVHYSNLANEEIQNVLTDIADSKYITYENVPDEAREIFEKYKINLNSSRIAENNFN